MTITHLIILSMVAAGMLGGAVNFFMADPPPEKAAPANSTTEKSSGAKPLKWWQHLIIGVSAAFVVPVFLNMISSTLISEIKGYITDPGILSKLLVLDGFCLLAAISSRAFIRSMSDFLLQQVKEVREQVKQNKQQMDETQKTTTDVKKAVEDVKQQTEEKTQKLGELENSLKDVKDGVEDAKMLANIAQDASKVNVAPPPPKARAMGGSDDASGGAPFVPVPGNAPNDPWKGVFGKECIDKQKGRQLSAKVAPILSQPGWYAIELTVSTLPGAPPLLKPVQFFIHDTFPNNKPWVQPVNNSAVLHLKGWGAFSVGALADDGGCKLELDLSELEDAPAEFRSR